MQSVCVWPCVRVWERAHVAMCENLMVLKESPFGTWSGCESGCLQAAFCSNGHDPLGKSNSATEACDGHPPSWRLISASRIPSSRAAP